MKRHERKLFLALIASLTGITVGAGLIGTVGESKAANAASAPLAAYIAPSISISEIKSSNLCDNDTNNAHLCLQWSTDNTAASGTQSFTVDTNADAYTLTDTLADKLTGEKDSSHSVALAHESAKTPGTTGTGTISDSYKYSFSVTADQWATPADTYTQSFKYTATVTPPAAPTITSFTPTSYAIGSSDNTLTINGSSLISTYDIFIANDDTTQDDDHRCTVTSATDSEVKCALPNSLASGSYTIYLYAVGGSAQSASKLTVTKPSVCRNADSKSECTVDIDVNMIPIKYAGDPNGDVTPKWVVADTTKKGDWYDYSAKQWANAVTVKADALSKYKGATSGTTVDNNDVLGYFVYVPRYKYKVMTMSGSTTPAATNFEIQFEKNSATKSVPSAVGDWATHPAFTWGDTELNGFWMGKFETTGKIGAPTVKPNQVANISNTIGQQFTSAASIGVDDPTADTMGSTVSGITKNGHNLLAATSHMLKNSEWGAAAYLSASEFGAGVNKVLNNGAYNHKSNSSTSAVNSDADGNSASAWGGAATGCGTSSDSDTYSSNGYYFPQHTTTLNGTTLQYDDAMDGGSVCEKDSSDTTHAYNQSLGVKASTTNNVYGIYDMSGGMWEYVMGNYTTTAGQSSGSTSYVANTIKAPYADFYVSLTSNSNCTWATCGGAALYETKSWGSDYSYFVYSDYPWFIRGGNTGSGQNAGVFASSYDTGSAGNGRGFRVGLLVPASSQ